MTQCLVQINNYHRNSVRAVRRPVIRRQRVAQGGSGKSRHLQRVSNFRPKFGTLLSCCRVARRVVCAPTNALSSRRRDVRPVSSPPLASPTHRAKRACGRSTQSTEICRVACGRTNGSDGVCSRCRPRTWRPAVQSVGSFVPYICYPRINGVARAAAAEPRGTRSKTSSPGIAQRIKCRPSDFRSTSHAGGESI